MTSTDNIALTQEWSTGWWLWKKNYKVEAEQVDLPPELGFIPGSATAKVKIFLNGKIEHEADIPWMMPKLEIMLPLQVYMLSQQPDYPHPHWQPILEQFALLCEGFERPTHLYWGEGSIFD
jgi:hypothetical protein